MTAYERPTTTDWLLWLAIGAIVLLLALAAPRAAVAQDHYDATKRPTCETGKPQQVWLLNESSATDCDTTAGGSTPALCCCDGDASPAWAACSTPGGGSGTVTSVALTMPAEFSVSGSPVTTSGTLAVTEATQTANTVYAGPTSGGAAAPGFRALVAADLAAASPYQQYDPDRPVASPGTGGWSEEFTGDAETTATAWANQDSATISFEFDTAFIRGDTTNKFHTRYVAAPANADQTLTAKMHHVYQASGNADSCGIGLVNGGTEASPTATAFLYYGNFATDGIAFAYDTDYDPAAGIVQVGSTEAISLSEQAYSPHYLQLRYTDSTRNLEGLWSRDGIEFYSIGSTTLASDPISWNYNVRRSGDCRIWWWRLRTDANRNQASD